ncbi:MAG: cysteine-rich CWC family protein [Burkholderiaceae bacterium]
MQTKCQRCGVSFGCGANAGSCWCQALPALDLSALPKTQASGCFCPACLEQLIDAQHARSAQPASTTAAPDRP